MAPLTRLTLGMAVALLIIAGCRSTADATTTHDHENERHFVFLDDQLLPACSTLESRQCLPAGFEIPSADMLVAGNCKTKVTGGGLTEECDAEPILALFYNCYAFSAGQLGNEATSFNLTAMENAFLSYNKENNEEWNDLAEGLLAICKEESPASLTPRQQAVYSYTCIRWTLFYVCDRQQAKEGRLDAEGELRQAHFLSGDCELSPIMLLDTYGVNTSRTWEECSQEIYTGDNIALLYASEVSRVVCLLQEFGNDIGNVDFPKLTSVFCLGDNDCDTYLLNMTNRCKNTGLNQAEPVPSTHPEMTIEEFVDCWAIEGVFSCALQEAKEVASSFQETCAISVVN